MAAESESLPDLFARLHRDMQRAERSTHHHGEMNLRATDLARLFALYRAYGGSADWSASDSAIANLAAPVRRYIETLQAELIRLQKANLRFTAFQEPLPFGAQDLVDAIAHEVDYPAFILQAHRDFAATRADRRRARDKARAIIALLIRRKCLVPFEAPPPNARR